MKVLRIKGVTMDRITRKISFRLSSSLESLEILRFIPGMFSI